MVQEELAAQEETLAILEPQVTLDRAVAVAAEVVAATLL
jgi:hypothetical protein